MRVSAFVYRTGQWLCLRLPRRAAYAFAENLAALYSFFSSKDKKIIQKNMQVIQGKPESTLYGTRPSGAKDEQRLVQEVFVNFARYLVDFLSFRRVDEAFIREYVRIQGEENLIQARSLQKGVIVISAHLGNWELGGLIAGIKGYSLYAVALSHASPAVNAFFNEQRNLGRIQVIPLGSAIKRCFKLLKDNQLVAFVGDKEFGTNGFETTMFGRRVLVPPGPAFFALKTGSPIVPCFMVREADKLSYRLVFETPIQVRDASGQERSFDQLINEYVKVMEHYIKMYPTQWFMFSDYFYE